MAESNKQRRERIKQELLQRRGGKCADCGYKKTMSALCFHHLNPKEKKFNVSGVRLSGVSRKRLEAEVDKCIVLCLNCHVERHDKEGHIHEDEKRTPK